MRNSILFFLVIGCFFACKTPDEVTTTEIETETSKVDELVFGLYYGRCAGDCTHFFKLRDGQLFKDAIEGRYDGQEWDVFGETALKDENYRTAAGLLESIPDALLESTEEKFGSPNVADQGTILVVAIQDGTQLGPWQIDPRTDALPENLQAFQMEMRTAIDALMD